jgi:hydrogenase expression/formation protein HypD
MMKHLDEYRDAKIAKQLIQKIRSRVSRPWVVMDVCGGQTHNLVRYGIENELAGFVELIHGPGCPVCVTSSQCIDLAVELCQRPHTIVASFGDMIRVPGSASSLSVARSQGGKIRIVYSPVDAVAIAAENPESQVVFFAVGFETTVPSTAIAVLQAAELGLKNFSILSAHVRVLPAMRTILDMPDNRVDAFLAAGHVCCITGYADYEPFVNDYQVPVIVTGFEPIDLLEGILRGVELLEQGIAKVENRYGRGVHRDGNLAAQKLIDRVYVTDDSDWRGFGTISGGGYRLRQEYAAFDARIRFGCKQELRTIETCKCRGADVMSGKIKPKECAEFGINCTPESPLGAPMVSSEGACAAVAPYRIQDTLDVMQRHTSVGKPALICDVRFRKLLPVLIARGLGADQRLDEPLAAMLPRIC